MSMLLRSLMFLLGLLGLIPDPRGVTTHGVVHDLHPLASARVVPSLPVVSKSLGDLHVLWMRNAARESSRPCNRLPRSIQLRPN
jgi:hypothetical protein